MRERKCITCGKLDHWYTDCPTKPFANMIAGAVGLPAAQAVDAVRVITQMLKDREWAEHVSRDPDIVALSDAITELHNELAGEAGLLAVVQDQLTATQDKLAALIKSAEVASGDLHMLNKAIAANDPKSELVQRISDARDQRNILEDGGQCGL